MKEKTETSAHCCSPLYPSACPAQLPSSFCCFAACVDVYGTHSNVHLRCFHTGKSTATRAVPSPWKLPVSWSVVIPMVRFCVLSPCLCCIYCRNLAVWLQTHSCPLLSVLVWGHLLSEDICVFIAIFIQISVALEEFFPLNISRPEFTWE